MKVIPEVARLAILRFSNLEARRGGQWLQQQKLDDAAM